MKSILFTLLCVLAGAAQAQEQTQTQTVWRCGPDGRSYTDSPCPEGRAIELPENRPAADVQQAQSMARREQARAAQLGKERQRSDARAPAAPAGIRGSRLAAEPVTSKAKAPAKGKHRLEAPGTWRAVVPASRRGKD